MATDNCRLEECPLFPRQGSALSGEVLLNEDAYSELLSAGSLILKELALRDRLPEEASVIMALGSDFEEVADVSAELFCRLEPQFIVAAGGRGRLTPAAWTSEGKRYAEIFRLRGIPDGRIIVESLSTNTAENLSYGNNLLKQAGWKENSVVVCQYPPLQLRAILTAKKILLNCSILSWSPFLPDLNRPLGRWQLGEWRRRLLWDGIGEVFRICVYQLPHRNYIVPFKMSEAVLEAAGKIAARLLIDDSIPESDRAQLQELKKEAGIA